MSIRNVRMLEHPGVRVLAERFAAASGRKRKAAEEMRAIKLELYRRGYDEFGVSHQLRASLRATKGRK